MWSEGLIIKEQIATCMYNLALYTSTLAILILVL